MTTPALPGLPGLPGLTALQGLTALKGLAALKGRTGLPHLTSSATLLMSPSARRAAVPSISGVAVPHPSG